MVNADTTANSQQNNTTNQVHEDQKPNTKANFEIEQKKQEEKEKNKISNLMTKTNKEMQEVRLKKVDNYIKNVEQGVVKKSVQEQEKLDIDQAIDKDKQAEKLQEAIKNNLTGYDLEKEL